MRRHLALLAVLVFGGCSALAPNDESLPMGAVPLLAVGDSFKDWYRQTEACAGLSGRFNRIEWYVVPGANTFETKAGPKVGMWERVRGVTRIVIAGRYADHEMVVRHEMLHDLLDREGHPPEYFVDRCHLTWDTWS